MAEMESLMDLLEDELKDLYSAENQLSKALPRMAKKAASKTLKDAFTKHLKETEGHVKRLEKIGKSLDIKLTGKVCQAMKGLVEEGKEILGEKGEPSILDAALIGAAQRVEHYEIAGYGVVRSIAQKLEMDDVAQLLQQTLDEEGETDKKLTQIAEEEVYGEAAMAGANGEEEG